MRDDVIEATLIVLKEKKLEKTSMKEILKKLKMSAGSAYYYFKNKNEIYEKMVEYAFVEIMEKLYKVKKSENIKTYLYDLTKALIFFLEEREELLFLLLNIKGSSYLNKNFDSRKFLKVFEKLLLKIEPKEYADLRLHMFIGSIYEVLYMKKIVNKKNMTKEEIKRLCEFFWGDIKNYIHTKRLDDKLNAEYS